MLDPDGGKYQGEFLPLADAGKTDDLTGQLVVRQPRSREDGELLPPHQGVHAVDGGDPGFDEILGIGPGHRVHRTAVDIPQNLGNRGRTAVPGPAETVEDPPQHLFAHRQAKRASEKPDPNLLQGQPAGPFEDLDHGQAFADLQDPAVEDLAGREDELHVLVVADSADRFEKDQGPPGAAQTDIFSLTDAHDSPFSAFSPNRRSARWRASSSLVMVLRPGRSCSLASS